MYRVFPFGPASAIPAGVCAIVMRTPPVGSSVGAVAGLVVALGPAPAQPAIASATSRRATLRGARTALTPRGTAEAEFGEPHVRPVVGQPLHEERGVVAVLEGVDRVDALAGEAAGVERR
jgi:hypothetical protein